MLKLKQKKKAQNSAFQYCFTKYQDPTDMYKKLHETDGTKNDAQIYLIEKFSNEVKKYNKIAEAEKYVIEGNNKIMVISIVECIIYFNQPEQQQRKGLKLLTPKQMLSRLPITLAQLNAGYNSEKLKNEIRQLLYSLYRSKKLTKQLYTNLIDII